MKLQLGAYTFKLALLPVIALLAGLTLLIVLGVWQLDRANEKTQIIQEYAQRREQPPVAFPHSIEDPAYWRYRRVRVGGRFDPQHQFLLDNQVNKGEIGFNVLTPLITLNHNQMILVDRGWVPLVGDRERLPEIATPIEAVRLDAQVYVPLGQGFRLGSITQDQRDWPKVIQYIDLEALSALLGRDLEPMILRLDPASPYGYRRNWPVVSAGPERNLAYAFQWFALAAALLVIYLVINIQRGKRYA